MAISYSHGIFNTILSISAQHRTVNPLLRGPSLYKKPNKFSTLKLIRKESGLKEGFQSLNELLTNIDNGHLVYPEEAAYASVLELCASTKCIFQGQQLHTHIVKKFGVYNNSMFLDTKLVFMYGKCGSVSDAEKLFVKMTERTTFAWNAMIGAYLSDGNHIQALDLYREMRVLGSSLDAFTFPVVLKACAVLKDIRAGAEIHGLVIKCGFHSTVFVANALVTMYAKCDDLIIARQLFDRIDKIEDVVSWNSMISAYSASGQSAEALGLFGKMQRAGLPANAYTFVSALQACEDPSYWKFGLEIHAAIMRSSDFLDVYVCNALIAMYARSAKMAEASRVFRMLDNKDKVSWNSIIAGFVQQSLYHEGVQFFREMQWSGLKPDEVSILSVIAASGRLNNLLNGMELHAYAIKHNYVSNLRIGNTLIDMYAKCHCTDYMGRTFDMMLDKDFISWTTIMAGYAQSDYKIKALHLFREVQIKGMDADAMMLGSVMLACSELRCLSKLKEVHGYVVRKGLDDLVLQNIFVDVYGECGNIYYATQMFESIAYKDIVSWTSMISSYVHNGLSIEALELFYSMRKSGIEPDYISLVSLLSAVASLSVFKKAKEIHCYLIRKGFSLEGNIANSLVDTYARCGALENAQTVFNDTQTKSVIQWTSMINAYGMHGRGKEATELFSRMLKEDINPDSVTFLALLYACSHSGLINEGKMFLEMMEIKYRFLPKAEHYACLVDLLGRANQLEEAYRFVKSMQIEPTAAVWCAFVGACQVHSNRELGEIAARKLLELEPRNPGNYVLVSNVFASSRRWKDVERVRTKMKENGLKKNPGCSWVQVGNKIHTFLARDKSHPEIDEIYRKLDNITKKLEREGGYIAQTKFVMHNIDEKEKTQMLHGHSERLAIAYGLLKTHEQATLRITKNLRVCGDCHTFCKLVSKFFDRTLVIRDANRFHHFEGGLCSCGDIW